MDRETQSDRNSVRWAHHYLILKSEQLSTLAIRSYHIHSAHVKRELSVSYVACRGSTVSILSFMYHNSSKMVILQGWRIRSILDTLNDPIPSDPGHAHSPWGRYPNRLSAGRVAKRVDRIPGDGVSSGALFVGEVETWMDDGLVGYPGATVCLVPS